MMELNKIITLMENANTILNKYDEDYVRPKETFIHNFDRYIFQTLEEVYEARDASYDEFLEEVADILNYTATMANILKHNLGINPKWTMDKNLLLERDEISPMYIDHCKKKLAFIYDDLISMRRRFPQRKWHKKEDMKDFKEVLEECLTICLETMSALFALMGFTNLIDVAIKKQEFIIGLDKVN